MNCRYRCDSGELTRISYSVLATHRSPDFQNLDFARDSASGQCGSEHERTAKIELTLSHAAHTPQTQFVAPCLLFLHSFWLLLSARSVACENGTKTTKAQPNAMRCLPLAVSCGDTFHRLLCSPGSRRRSLRSNDSAWTWIFGWISLRFSPVPFAVLRWLAGFVSALALARSLACLPTLFSPLRSLSPSLSLPASRSRARQRRCRFLQVCRWKMVSDRWRPQNARIRNPFESLFARLYLLQICTHTHTRSFDWRPTDLGSLSIGF